MFDLSAIQMTFPVGPQNCTSRPGEINWTSRFHNLGYWTPI